MEEVWRSIAGYEGLYEVSNHGRVKSLPRTLPHDEHGTWRLNGKILKPGLAGQHGNQYLIVVLHSGHGKQKVHRVHRLVAETFLDKVPGKTVVNHKDCNRLNNAVSNLEWCTPLENTQHAKLHGRFYEGNLKRSKPVVCIETGKRYNSLNDAAREYHIRAENITRNINGRYRSAGGHKWRWAD